MGVKGGICLEGSFIAVCADEVFNLGWKRNVNSFVKIIELLAQVNVLFNEVKFTTRYSVE